MNTKLVLKVYAVYSLLMGAAFLLMAAKVLDGMGVMEPSSLFIATQQIWGTYIIGIGSIAWFMSGSEETDFFKGMITLTGLVVIVTLYHIFIQGLGAVPLYLNVVVNGAVAAFCWPKMR